MDTAVGPSYSSGVPAFVSLPRPLQVAVVAGYVETVGLGAYGISIAAFESSGATAGVTGSDLAPGILIAIYACFALILFVVTTGLGRLRRRAFTPFLLSQGFGLVVAQPLLAEPSTRAAGAVIAGIAAVGAVAVLWPAGRERFR